MADRKMDLYKGYHIVTSSSGGTIPPYVATFGVAEALPDGTSGPTLTRNCGATFQTEQEAHAVADARAREFVDSLLKEK